LKNFGALFAKKCDGKPQKICLQTNTSLDFYKVKLLKKAQRNQNQKSPHFYKKAFH